VLGWQQVKKIGQKIVLFHFASSVSSSNIFKCDGFLLTEKVARYKTKQA
jgi:hypothetical protein